MKKSLFVILLILGSFSSFADEIYFTKDSSDRFACKIARSIKETYPDKTFHNFRVEIYDILREEIAPYVDADPIPAGFSLPKFAQKVTGISGFPAGRSEYWLQNAFILYGNPKLELKEPSENYFASFIHLARARHVAYLNNEAERFQLRNESNLLQQIEDHLPYVANYSFPYKDSDGQVIMQKTKVDKEKNRFTLAIGNPNHKKYNQFVYESQRFNQFASPLFMWLLKQEDFSVSPEKLFDKALEIYGNPFVAIGVIPWIFSGDALTVSRGTSSVVSYKMERLVEGDDVPGFQYHFWGYFIQGLSGNKFRVNSLSYAYETLYQKDKGDRIADVLSFKLSDKVRSSFKNLDQCSH